MNRLNNYIIGISLFFLISCSIDDSKGKSNKAGIVHNKLEITHQLSKNDIKLKEPLAGEWRYYYKEGHQDLNSYINSITHRDENSNVIYIQPLGDFDSLENQLINETVEYLKLYYPAKVSLLATKSLESVPDNSKRIHGGNHQIHAPHILYEILEKDKFNDGIAHLAITNRDLYPKKSWNYVFGLANYEKQVGVCSFNRYVDEVLNPDDFELVLNRIIKTSTHEINHMLMMKHCVENLCIMNGANSLVEMENRPNRLCSICNSKLMYTFQHDVYERLKGMEAFFKSHNMNNDLELVQKDLITLNKLI
ncbi:archaemetzincin [Marinigracilibium pacificum]|uniref:Archaemetzincin n=1 Tax=Marinigracilibium pacificum TaxID=2729599 RepID=A0A848J248_9BACT|nr:archaemetzincin [Marinigracilibium pacificum]NMM48554.1 hypothetical protein [Marinigracilibium pacificum]